jgi:hypothetical protein
MATCTLLSVRFFTKVKGKDKLLDVKWDSFCKHVGCKKISYMYLEHIPTSL